MFEHVIQKISDDKVIENMRRQIMETGNLLLRLKLIASLKNPAIKRKWMNQTRYLMQLDYIFDEITNKINTFDEGYNCLKIHLAERPAEFDNTSDSPDFENTGPISQSDSKHIFGEGAAPDDVGHSEANHNIVLWAATASMIRFRICELEDCAESIIAYLLSNFEVPQMIEILCSNPEEVGGFSDDDKNTIFNCLDDYIDSAEPLIKTRAMVALTTINKLKGYKRVIDFMSDPNPQVNFNACILMNIAMGKPPFSQETLKRKMDEMNGSAGDDDLLMS